MTPIPLATRDGALPWRDFIHRLEDAVVVVDGRGRVVQANPASHAWIVPDRDGARDDVAGLLGVEAAGWLVDALAGRPVAHRSSPSLRLPGGRRARLDCSRLDERHWAVRVVAAEVDDTAASRLALEQVFDAVPVGLLVFDGDGRVHRANATFEAWLGAVPARLDDATADVRALVGWRDGALDAGGGLDAEGGCVADAPDAPAARAAVRLRSIAVGGAPARALQACVRRHPGGAVPRYLLVVEDRSAQVQRDLAHVQIGAVMDTAGVGVATFSPSALAAGDAPPPAASTPALRTASGELARIGRELVAPASRADYERLQVALRAGEGAQARYEIHHPDHGARWLLTRVEPARLAGGERTMAVVTLDVTEQQHGQAHRRELRQELEVLQHDRELMFSLSEVGIAFVRDGVIQRANEAMAELTGWTAQQLATLDAAALSADAPAFGREQAEERRDLQRHGRWSGERQLRRRDGRLLWVQVGKRLVHRERPAEGLIASYVDIDARHRAERAVSLQAERTRAILDSALVGIVTVGPHGIEWMNRSAQRMFGGRLPDFVGAAMACVATPEADHPFRRTQYLDELVEGQAETFECRVLGRDGREFRVVGNAVATNRERGGRQLTYALLDVERRRQAEARLSEAQTALQQVISAAPLAIALIDAARLEILQVNDVAAAALGATSAAQLVGRTPAQIVPARLAAARGAELRAALDHPGVTVREYRVAAGRGTPARIWDARLVPLARAAGLPADRLLLVATDVTEQRAAQDARLEAAIRQRELLVREVHHRIKNNLQGVAGLLQQIAERKPEVASVIGEVVGQVQAIAHVHGLQVGAQGRLRVRGIVEAISASVQRTFGHPVECRGDGGAPGWTLPESEAIPIALTLNELLTNAVKHRHPRDAPADVVCALTVDAGGVCIAVSNPGRLPAGFSLAGLRRGVSGLGLVRALLPRRDAELAIEQQGACVVARLRLRPPVVATDADDASPTMRSGADGRAERTS